MGAYNSRRYASLLFHYRLQEMWRSGFSDVHWRISGDSHADLSGIASAGAGSEVQDLWGDSPLSSNGFKNRTDALPSTARISTSTLTSGASRTTSKIPFKLLSPTMCQFDTVNPSRHGLFILQSVMYISAQMLGCFFVGMETPPLFFIAGALANLQSFFAISATE